jgi:hypothetical protein
VGARVGLSVVLVGLSGFLYVAIVVGWAVYLVPLALRRYDEATRHRSIDRFSSAMRVLGRSEQDEPTEAATPAPRPAPPAERTAAKVAARRRRRILLVFLVATTATVVAAVLGAVPWWSVAVPAGLTVVWLLLCRRQVRRARAARPSYSMRGRTAHSTGEDVAEPPAFDQEVAAAPLEAPADDEPTVELRRADLAEAAGGYDGQGSLWDPVPVTLPTYVTKPVATRTVRTIDLGEPGAWTSGRTAESAEIAREADAAARAVRDADAARAAGDDQPRVVGG